MKNRSFTLIELLIVIVIIGILAVLALPQYEKIIRRAHAVEAKETLRAISDAVWRYYIETGEFPQELPPPFEIPSCLDIKPPASKYFRYSYFAVGGVTPQDTFGVVLASYINYYVIPRGETASYIIGYRKAAPTTDQVAHKMDDVYYRYYIHVIWPTPLRPEWVWNWDD